MRIVDDRRNCCTNTQYHRMGIDTANYAPLKPCLELLHSSGTELARFTDDDVDAPYMSTRGVAEK